MAQKAILQADVVLSLGCRFSERSTTNWRLRFNGSLIQVDIDEQELGRNYPASLSIKSDLKLFINELTGAQLRRNNLTDDSWLVSLNHEKAIKEKEYEKYDSLSGNPIRPQTIVREIQRSIPDDTLIVAETGYAFWWSAQMLKVDKPRSVSRTKRRFDFRVWISCSNGSKVCSARSAGRLLGWRRRFYVLVSGNCNRGGGRNSVRYHGVPTTEATRRLESISAMDSAVVLSASISKINQISSKWPNLLVPRGFW